MDAIFETSLPGIERHARGKVRDVYSAGEFLVIVATDRLSAFDYVLPTPIPDKGKVLTRLTLFWLDLLRDIVPNHFVSANVADYPAQFRPYREQLEGRSMLVRRATMIDVECVARGHVSGSGWKDYKREGRICGITPPAGLRESDKLPEPIFTPATKAQSGHDENISFETAAIAIGDELAGRLRTLTLQIYRRAAEYAETRGVIIADTKFEFGFIGDQLTLADEVLTPDSSRFWPRASYQPGGPQPSFDKQYVRDYLESVHWNKQPPAPALPADVIHRTSDKYREAYRVLTGEAAMNWIDLLLLLVIVFSILSGLMAGFARVGVGFIATILGIFFGFWCYGIVAAYFLDYVSSRAIANLIGFLIIFMVISVLGAIVGRLLAKFFKWVGLSWFDRLLGGAFGVVRGVIIAIALVTVLMAFAPSPPPRSVVDSKLMPTLAGASDFFALMTPHEIKDAFRDAREKAEKAWSEHARRESGGLRRE